MLKGFKIANYQSWTSEEKVCLPAPDTLELIGPRSRTPGFKFRSRFNHSQSLMAGNFAALWPTDFKFSAIKDLNLLKKYTKNQEASSILRVDFALSKWPHFHRELSNRPGMVVRHCIELLGIYYISLVKLRLLKFYRLDSIFFARFPHCTQRCKMTDFSPVSFISCI